MSLLSKTAQPANSSQTQKEAAEGVFATKTMIHLAVDQNLGCFFVDGYHFTEVVSESLRIFKGVFRGDMTHRHLSLKPATRPECKKMPNA